MRLIYSESAIADLVRLRAFVAEKDPSAAARAAELLVRLEHLSVFPELGRSVAHAPQPHALRDVTFGKYLVRYSLHAGSVIVLRVWHQLEDRAPPLS